MSDASPAQPQPIQRRQVLRLVATAAAAALGLGYVLHDFDHEVVAAMARHMITVALLMLALGIAEIRQERREARLERRLSQMEEQLEERLHEAAHAEGFVAGIQRRDAAGAQEGHLRSVR